jgi:hypothetical protein
VIALRPLRWALLWALLILMLCLIPGRDLPQWRWADLMSLDKLAHAVLFAVLMVLIVRGLRKYPAIEAGLKPTLFALVFSILYGGALEIMQGSLLNDRVADLGDFVANTIGCGLGWLLLVWRERRQRRAGGT